MSEDLEVLQESHLPSTALGQPMQMSFKNGSFMISYILDKNSPNKKMSTLVNLEIHPSGRNYHLVENHSGIKGPLIKLQSFNCHRNNAHYHEYFLTTEIAK